MNVRITFSGLSTPSIERAVQQAFDELVTALGPQALSAIQKDDRLHAAGKTFRVLGRAWSLDRPDPAIEQALDITLQLT